MSSTCYDLIDVRAVLEERLKQSGLTPVLSDRPTSEFMNSGEANSIEVCLQNLRQCERVVLVLSQRYGRSLKDKGFDDVSATHLEYIEARKANIPILFYVRDRLDADYEQRRKNPDSKPLWAVEKDADSLFRLIKEHRELTNTDQNNWFWSFSSAVDLSDRVLKDLGAVSSNAMLRQLMAIQAVPLLTLSKAATLDESFFICVKNSGACVATRINFEHPDGTRLGSAFTLRPGESHLVRVPHTGALGCELFGTHPAGHHAFILHYDTMTGVRVREAYAVLMDNEGTLHFVSAGMEVEGESLRMKAPKLTKWGQLTMVDRAALNQAYNAYNI